MLPNYKIIKIHNSLKRRPQPHFSVNAKLSRSEELNVTADGAGRPEGWSARHVLYISIIVYAPIVGLLGHRGGIPHFISVTYPAAAGGGGGLHLVWNVLRGNGMGY